MSESEGRKQLTGLARSIDALFAGSTATDVAPLSEPVEQGQEGVESGAVMPPPLPEVREVVVDTPPPLPEVEEVVDEAPPLAEPEDIVDEEPPPLPDLEKAVDETPPLPDLEEVVAETPPPLPMVEEVTPQQVEEVSPQDLTLAAGEEEDEPTDLDRAVDAYVAGEPERAGEIERLAAEMLEAREVEPIARSVARLVLAAGDPPDAAVYPVAEAIMSPVVLGRLARRMGSERSEERRKQYYRVCRVIGADMAVAIRDDLAETTDRLARRIHCEALVQMGEPGRAMIEEMAVDENRFLVRNAVVILGDLGGPGAVQLVTSALANPDARVRREALRSLARLGDAESGVLVVGLLDDADADVRTAAAVAAGELRVERALRPLIAMLDATSDPDRVLPLVRALGQIGDPGAVPSIEKHAVTSLFSKPRTDVRIASYRALHAIGTPHARKLLNRAVDDRDPEVKAAVKGILGMR